MSRPNKQEYGTGFLYAEDLLKNQQFQTVTVEIAEVIEPHTITAANGKVVDKYCLKFVGKSKILALCKTSASIIHFVTGDPPGPEWVGKTITLQVRNVEAFGEQVLAIRVIPPAGTRVRKTILQRLGTKAEFKANG